MYWQFYDLKQNPFSLTPDPAFSFRIHTMKMP